METGESNLLVNALIALAIAIVGGLAVLWIWESRPILKRWRNRLSGSIASGLLRLAAPTGMPLAGLILGILATASTALLAISITYGHVDPRQVGSIPLFGSAALIFCWLIVLVVWRTRPQGEQPEQQFQSRLSVFDKASLAAAMAAKSNPLRPALDYTPNPLSPAQTHVCKSVANRILTGFGTAIPSMPLEDWVLLFLASQAGIGVSEKTILKNKPHAVNGDNIRLACLALKTKGLIGEIPGPGGSMCWILGPLAVRRIETLKLSH
ncbi:hypothetical protein [Pseudomonas sp. 9Ag]|uniref:hypothetical protein n=1 Tax=Pseudomonas sp. 9Ag TaxID=2653167 RepID=UPI0012F42A34|nr:hypothetical protein [Pseudomonas sp. 9Ag]VXD04158.1 membrane hypothetical protein [Pseudomonas sp. 9Ag]